jgi:hypothetical protein
MGLLRLAKMKLEDAVHIQLLATAEAYCASLISYQVRPERKRWMAKYHPR